MSKLIAIDDGHGMETPGKRTPKFEDGSFMKENEFNKRVAELLNEHLIRCGFKTVMVAPTDVDTPLAERVKTANNAKADFYISIHANAAGDGNTFNNGKGIETFYNPGSINGEKAAKIIHRHLLNGTKLVDRGVKSTSFYVLKNTKMPAVLVECGFMTNYEEALLLKSESYRAECAEELAKGICEYFGIAYVERKSEPSSSNSQENKKPIVSGEVNVVVDGKQIANGYLINNTTYVPLRAIGEAIDANVNWDQKTQTATITTKK